MMTVNKVKPLINGRAYLTLPLLMLYTDELPLVGAAPPQNTSRKEGVNNNNNNNVI